MDLARRMYSRELKVAAMREIDSARTISEVARQLELSPKLLERWRSEWRARGELAFPGNGRRGVSRGFPELQRIGELERKIGQLTMERSGRSGGDRGRSEIGGDRGGDRGDRGEIGDSSRSLFGARSGSFSGFLW